MNVYGLAVSEGEIVSLQDRRDFAATITFDVNNRASIIYTNWPQHRLRVFSRIPPITASTTAAVDLNATGSINQ